MYLGMSYLTNKSPESNTEKYQTPIELPQKDRMLLMLYRMLLMLNLDNYKTMTCLHNCCKQEKTCVKSRQWLLLCCANM
jgi:hypothetical protein